MASKMSSARLGSFGFVFALGAAGGPKMRVVLGSFGFVLGSFFGRPKAPYSYKPL